MEAAKFRTRSSPRLIAVLMCSLTLFSCHRDPDVMKRKYFEGGDKYFRNSKYREARIMYLSALKFDARFGPAYYGLARADLKLNDLQETVRALRRAVELLPDSPERDDARVKLADIFLLYLREGPFQREVFEQASNLAAELLERAPNSFDAHRIAGAISLVRLQDLSGRLPKEAQREMLRAIAELETANRIQPDQPDVLIPLVRCLEISSRGAEAEKMLREAIGRNQHNIAAYRDLHSYFVGTKRPNDARDILELAIKNNPKESSFLIDLAHDYQAMDKPEKAVKVIEGIAARSAEFPEAFVVAGDFYVGIGRPQDAIRQYEKGAAAFPADKLSYQTRIVGVYAANHRLVDAERINDAILKDHPKNVDALVRRAAILFETGDVKRSITELEGALCIAPSNPEAHFNLGRALLAGKQAERARYQFTEAIRWAPANNAARLALAQIELDAGEYGKAVLAADEALANQPKDLRARLIRSMGLRGLKKFDESRAELNAILAVSPKDGEALYQLGDVEQSVGNAKGAEAHYRKAYETNPANPQGLLAIAQLAIAQNKPGRALKVIQGEIRKSPERLDLHLALASTAQRLRRFEVATSELEWLATKVQPNSAQYAEVEARLAECSLLRKDLPSALKQIEVARKLQPDNPMVLHNLGLIYDSLGRRKEARQVYEASLRLNEDDGVVLNNLAYLIAEDTGELDQALTFAQRARQKMPNQLGFIDTIGWIYFKKNLPDNALEVFEDLVRKKPAEPTFRYHLGLVLLQKGQTFRARQELQAALASHPSVDESGKIALTLAGISGADLATKELRAALTGHPSVEGGGTAKEQPARHSGMKMFLIAAWLSLAAVGLALLFLYRTLSLRQHGEISLDQCLVLQPERYQVMERLFPETDFRFLATQPGFSPQMGRRFRAERRRIFRVYLRNLRKDFGRMALAVQTLIVHAAEDRGDLAAALMRQRLLFVVGMIAIEARLLLHAVGVGMIDVGGMVEAAETMQVQIRLLLAAAQAAPAKT